MLVVVLALVAAAVFAVAEADAAVAQPASQHSALALPHALHQLAADHAVYGLETMLLRQPHDFLSKNSWHQLVEVGIFVIRRHCYTELIWIPDEYFGISVSSYRKWC